MAQRGPLLPEQVVDRRHDQVEVFGLGKVGDEEHDQAQRAPKTDMPADFQRLRLPARPDGPHGSCKRLPGITSQRCHMEALSKEAESDMQQDEEPNNEGIAPDTARSLGMQQRALAYAERLGPEHKPPQQQGGHPDQGCDAQDVCSGAIQVSDQAAPHENEIGDVALEHIPEVDQKVVHEAPCDETMEQADQRPGAECRAQSDRLEHQDIERPSERQAPVRTPTSPAENANQPPSRP